MMWVYQSSYEGAGLYENINNIVYFPNKIKLGYKKKVRNMK